MKNARVDTNSGGVNNSRKKISVGMSLEERQITNAVRRAKPA
jgi:hypothetical protein